MESRSHQVDGMGKGAGYQLGMNSAAGFVLANIVYVAALLGAVSVAVGVLAVKALVSARRLQRRFRRVLRAGGEGLVQRVEEVLALAEGLADRMNGLEAALEAVRERVDAAPRRVGLVRFNAFPGTGSDLSFSIALLNEGGNGLVISSLYGRDESRVYAKPVMGGGSRYPLSMEEKEAIAQASGGGFEAEWGGAGQAR